MLKRALRRWIVRTSVPPIDGLYRGVFGVLVRLSALLLGRHPGLVAAYVCRGWAKNEIVPGLSDIDLMLIARRDADVAGVRRLFRALNILSFRIIEYYPKLVTTRETFEHRWRTAPLWQYRYLEGKSTWKLLCGEDVLASLPPLSEGTRRFTVYQEMTRWWLTFAHHVLGTTSRRGDAVLRNAICYKCVAELRNLRRTLDTGADHYSRRDAFRDDDSPLGRRMVRMAQSRFLARDDGLPDDTLRFLLDSYDDLWRSFAERPYVGIDRSCTQSVDSPEAERDREPTVDLRVRAIEAHLAKEWQGLCAGVRVVRSAFWDFEDRLVIVELVRDRIPEADRIAGLVALHGKLENGRLPRTFLFLRRRDLVFPITPVLPRDLHRALLTPATMPDVFLQLGVTPVYWTDYTKWYLADWRTNEQWTSATGEKRRQLEIIARGAARGSVTYPLSSSALERAAEPDDGESRPIRRGA